MEPVVGGVPHQESDIKIPLKRKMTWWILVLPVLMFVAIFQHNLYLINFTHVTSGVLWTGADIFMGFLVGPVLRRLHPEQRKAVINWLTPKTMLYMPVVAITTGTSGWIMANWFNMLADSSPSRPVIYFALIMITILTIMGFGFLLPNSIRTYLELQKDHPNVPKILKMNSRNNMIAGVQGVCQILILLAMAFLVVR